MNIKIIDENGNERTTTKVSLSVGQMLVKVKKPCTDEEIRNISKSFDHLYPNQTLLIPDWIDIIEIVE